MIKKENNRAVFTVLLMIAATLGAKATGMLRQMMTASIFAAGMEGVAFSAAAKIPFAIFDMLFSTAILGSFLPIYRGYLLSDEKRAAAFSSSFFTVTGILTAGTAVLGILFAPSIVTLAAPNLDEPTLLLSTALLRIMFPAVIFAGMAYTLIGIMQSHEKFLLPATISAISNAVIILYLTLCNEWQNKTTAIYGLTIAYLLSWVIQFLVLAVPLLHIRRMPRPSVKFRNPDLMLAGKRTLPVMLGAWLIPVITLIANAFSSYIDISNTEANISSGAAIVVFENAFSVFSIAGGLMTYGICNYLFPKLSAKFASGDADGFRASTQAGLSCSLAVTVPIAVFLFLLSDEIVRVLYLRGNFSEELAISASQSLRMLSLALPAYAVIEFLSRASYSCGKVKYPMIGALIGIPTGLCCASVCMLTNTLSVSTVARSVVFALVASALTQALCMRHILWKRLSKTHLTKSVVWLIGILLSVFVMTFIHEILKKSIQKPTAFQNLVIIAIVFLLGFMVYLVWIFLFRHQIFSNTSSGKEETF